MTIADVYAAVLAREASKEGAEIRFRCPEHAPDKHPSARFNLTKLAWVCDVCLAGGGVRDLARRLGVTAGDVEVPSQVKAFQPSRDLPAVSRPTDRSAVALALWRRSVPIEATVAERYLKSRGLVRPFPSSLRYLANAKHRRSGLAFPAMVAAAMRWPDTEPTAIHRTFLRYDGSSKADVEPPRMALGPLTGAAIRFAAPGEVLVVGEGIETTMSVQQSTGFPGWSAMCAKNLSRVVLPELPCASTVIVAADADSAGLDEAYRAARLWTGEGRNVLVAVPSAGDFNDVLTGRL